jgi:arginine N-succinyltransferase
MLIRPISANDLDALVSMAEASGTGVTTLPVNTGLLAEKIKASELSFSRQSTSDQGHYLFALEDVETGHAVGVCGIEAAVGLDQVWYNYRLSVSVTMSEELGIHRQTPTLYLTNDLTGATEVCTLFLMPEYRKNENGRLLSLSRFMFMAAFPKLFHKKVFAEMRGVSDEDGRSPFWDALGEKFFKLKFSHADYLTGIGTKSFVAELMPKYPIYVPMLEESAQKVIGQVHPDTRPARAMLEREGFNFNGFIDIFDGGPALEAFLYNIRVIRQCEKALVHIEKAKEPVDILSEAAASTPATKDISYLVSNTEFENFRLIQVSSAQIDENGIRLSEKQAQLLGVTEGDEVLKAPIRDTQKEGVTI